MPQKHMDPADHPGTKKRRRLRSYTHLQAHDFMHPHDREATDALHKLPGFDRLIAKIMEYGLERVLYLQNIAENVRVTQKMLPRVHRYLLWSCSILGVAEPELYVSLNPVPNAYTYGHTRPFIVLTSGLVETLDEEELFFAVAHEVGHVKCSHSLYTSVARNIATIATVFGQATLGLGNIFTKGVELALYDWMRKSELSADRAALLCVQDQDVAVRTFMKLAGGARKLYPEMDQAEFLRQIQAYEEADASDINRVYKFFINSMRTHPFPILRAKSLNEWFASEAYRLIVV